MAYVETLHPSGDQPLEIQNRSWLALQGVRHGPEAENPRVGGSIAPLATTPTFLKRIPGITGGLFLPAAGENRPTIGLPNIGSGLPA